MKDLQKLSIFYVFLIFCSFSYCQKKEKQNTYSAYFFVKQLYSGPDAISSLLNSNFKMKLGYFTLNDNLLYYTSSSLEKTIIQGSLKISLIVNPKVDNLKTGKCCENVKKKTFESYKALSSDNESTLINLLKANYCLEIKAQDIGHWRLCSDKQNEIDQLHLKLIYAILKTKNKKNKEVLEKFFQNGKISPTHKESHFNWHDQYNWGGNCGIEKYQSPISIKKTTLVKSDTLNVDVNFLEVLISIERMFEEHIVKFKNDPGLIKVNSGNNNLFFKPKYMSFRFPGEHLINGKRFGAEILIHCDEIHPDEKRRSSNGLILTVPIEEKSDYPSNPIIESLNVDFWKFEVKEKGKSVPTEWESNKKLVFSMKDLFDSVLNEKPTYYFYLGSKTTPPCKENVYHLLVDKPIRLSTCQYRILREHSLQSEKPKEIHSRVTQKKNKRKVYSFTNIKNNPSIESYIPKNYALIAKKLTGKNTFGPKKLSTITTLKSLKFIKKSVNKNENSKTAIRANRLTSEKKKKIKQILKKLEPKIKHLLKKYHKIKKYMKYKKYKILGGAKNSKKVGGARNRKKTRGAKTSKKVRGSKNSKKVTGGKNSKKVRGGKNRKKTGGSKKSKKAGGAKNSKNQMKYLKYKKYKKIFAKLKKLRNYTKLIKYLKLKKQLRNSVKKGISVKSIIDKIKSRPSSSSVSSLNKEEYNC